MNEKEKELLQKEREELLNEDNLFWAQFTVEEIQKMIASDPNALEKYERLGGRLMLLKYQHLFANTMLKYGIDAFKE